MSRFFVGQRVRIVRVVRAREALGREGHVVSCARDCCDDQGFEYWGYEVSVDGIGPVSPDGYTYAFPKDCLEPIQPLGAKPSEFTTLADLLTSLDATVSA